LNAELEVLPAAAEAGCQIVDLEVESARKPTARSSKKFRAGLRRRARAADQLSRLYADQGAGAAAAARIEAFSRIS
jgi:hypothetical protein